jgi:hypothetical protein
MKVVQLQIPKEYINSFQSAFEAGKFPFILTMDVDEITEEPTSEPTIEPSDPTEDPVEETEAPVEETEAPTESPTSAPVIDSWSNDLPKVPAVLGEVCMVYHNGALYLIGEALDWANAQPKTYKFDLESGVWSTDLAPRPFPGTHHAAVVVNDSKWYVFGGLKGGEGKVQIYDFDSDSWSLGADMSWKGGSVSAALVAENKIIVAGGIVGTVTVGTSAIYDVATDSWTPVASMPAGRNHAAYVAVDGQMYVIGGRMGCNCVGSGFGDVFVFDYESLEWISGEYPELPEARGGMENAVYSNGKIYVIGGETNVIFSSATSNKVFPSVDILDLATKTWTLGADMFTARHRLAPTFVNGKIYVAAGGIKAGYSFSDAVEVYSI